VSARAIAAVAVVAMLACNHHKVTVPLTTPEATACADGCRTRYASTRPDLHRSCLTRCPGAREASGKCGADERPPAMACAYEGELKGPVAVAVGVGLILFAAVAVIGLALSAGADTIDDDPP